MLGRILIGNKIINLNEVNSTNEFLKNYLISNCNEPEGIVVNTRKQSFGKGQRGNKWESEPDKNLTFSVLLKPKINVLKQFDLTKMVSLSIIDLFKQYNIDAKIKWPNDIYVENKKIAGILIENSVKQNIISSTIVGIGLNVNQKIFNSEIIRPTSLNLIRRKKFNLNTTLIDLLNCFDKRYLSYKTDSKNSISEEYLSYLYLYKEKANFIIADKEIEATIIGVNEQGKLQLLDSNSCKIECDLKEISFLI